MATIGVVVVVLWALAIYAPARNVPVRAQRSGGTGDVVVVAGDGGGLAMVAGVATAGVRVGGP